MKMAFYGGAQIILSILIENISPGNGNPTPADLELLPNIQEELNEFADEMRRITETKLDRG
jgi:hypothetical protein